MQIVIEFRNKTNMWVNEKQAHVIDQAWENKALVTINGAKINTTEITGIYPQDVWYELHPKDRPRPVKENLPRLATIKPKQDGPGYQHFKKQLALLKRRKV